MKKEHPITYEHVAILFSVVLVLFVVISAVNFWTAEPKIEKEYIKEYVGVKSVVCYFKDGTGPASVCPAMIKCYNEARGNTNRSEMPCPFWPEEIK